MSEQTTQYQQVYDYVNAFLGGGMVDVELDPLHYETAIKKSFSKYRQRNENAVEESYISLTMTQDVNEYTLPNEIIEVRKAYRRSVGSRPGTSASGGPIYSTTLTATALQQVFNVNYNMAAVHTVIVTVNGATTTNYSIDDDQRTITFIAGLNAGDIVNIKLYDSGLNTGGTMFDPFNLAYTNAYLLAGSNMGGLVTYELFSQRQELIGRMFGSFLEFTWNTSTKKLTILTRPRAREEILLWCYNHRPDFEILNDYKANQWIKDYTLANCKYMLGEARSKFSTIAGPGGGTTLNGDSLKAEAQAEIEKLEKELEMSSAGGTGYGFLIG